MDPYVVDESVVKHIAKLASLDLEPGDESKFVHELNDVLSYMKRLNSAKTENLEATFQTFPSANVVREDVALPSLTPEAVLQNAPDREKNYFKMPPILESE